MAGREAQSDPVAPLADPAADLDQPESDGLLRHARDPSRGELAPERVEQPIRCRMEGQAESIGKAAMQPIIDPLLALTAIGVPTVELLGPIGTVVTTKRVVGPFGRIPAFMIPRRGCGHEAA